MSDAGPTSDTLATVQAAEAAGYDACWAAEAYGVDAATTLAWLAAQTDSIALGAGVFQIPARTPAMTAMTSTGLDLASNGRFRLGLGVSGPQVSEGWHGVPFAAPLGRTREYVQIVRMALDRQTVQFEGAHYQLPLPGGPGKALRMAARPVRAQVPIYLAAIGPQACALAGEIADGWLGVFVSPDHADLALAPIRRGAVSLPADFDAVAIVPTAVNADLAAARDAVRPHAALYVGGMGSKDRNFYAQHATRMGFSDAVRIIQEHYLAGRVPQAIAAVPDALIDATCLVGEPERIADRLIAYQQAGLTTVAISPFAPTARERSTLVTQVAHATQQLGALA